MTIVLIQVPYVLGDDAQGASEGPGRLLQAGADKLLAAEGMRITVERVERDERFRDSATASRSVCKQVAGVVRKTSEAGAFP